MRKTFSKPRSTLMLLGILSLSFLVMATQSHARFNPEGYTGTNKDVCFTTREAACNASVWPHSSDPGYSLVWWEDGLSCRLYYDGEPTYYAAGINLGSCLLPCQYPYSENEAGTACVKSCPPWEPTLNPATGQCMAEPAPQQCTAGNPIVIATGEKIQDEPADYSENRILPLTFQQNYRSFRAPETDPLFNLGARVQGSGVFLNQSDLTGWTHYTQPRNYNGGTGKIPPNMGVQEAWAPEFFAVRGYLQWNHTYSYHLVANGSEINLFRPSGGVERFVQQGQDFVSAVGQRKVVTAHADGWSYQPNPSITEIYNADGQLIRIDHVSSVYQTLSYNDYGKVSSITHSLGGEITLSYDDDTRIQRVDFPNSSYLTFQYDSHGNVRRVDTTREVDTANPITTTREYHYELAQFPYALTGMTDEKGVRFASWEYDNRGRAVESRHVNDTIDKVTFDYAVDNRVTVTNPLGKNTIYHYGTDSNGVQRLSWVQGVQSDNCAAANKSYTYDSLGFIASKTDWAGNVTTFIRDAQGREISRTEASGTPEAKTIETQWHPDFNLKTKIIEPSRIIEFFYDNNGNLLQQIFKTLD